MAAKYFMLEQKGQETNIMIYGDITSWEWFKSDVSSYSLARAIEGITSPVINVYINSYGGEVAEGVAIYRQLKRHSARVRTYCDGFACSSASIVFMAGDERIVYPTSMLMIHHAWLGGVEGNAEQLRKKADDLDLISQTATSAYMDAVNIDRETLDALLANETWLTPQQAVDMGFATQIAEEKTTGVKAALSARHSVFHMICDAQQARQKINPPPAPPASYATGGALHSGGAARYGENQAEIVLSGTPHIPIAGKHPPDPPVQDRMLRLLQAAVNGQTSRLNK